MRASLSSSFFFLSLLFFFRFVPRAVVSFVLYIRQRDRMHRLVQLFISSYTIRHDALTRITRIPHFIRCNDLIL